MIFHVLVRQDIAFALSCSFDLLSICISFQALPRTASLALEAPQQLLQQLLGQMSSSPDALRHIGRMCFLWSEVGWCLQM